MDWAFGGFSGLYSRGNGVPNFRAYLLGADSTGFFTRTRENYHSLVSKYDYACQLIWSESIDLESPVDIRAILVLGNWLTVAGSE
jgi:hypothetical protein